VTSGLVKNCGHSFYFWTNIADKLCQKNFQFPVIIASKNSLKKSKNPIFADLQKITPKQQ